MPLTKFTCPDNIEIPINQCIAKCRLPVRCLSKPTLLTIITNRREWSGIPSTTQLIGGTREAYLKVTEDYSVTPTDLAYSLLGTTHHRLLSQIKYPASIKPEQELSGFGFTGTADLLEEDEDNIGYYRLTDYKTYGSFRVAKLLGRVPVKVPAPNGEVYKKSGPWGTAGSPKYINVFIDDPAKIENRDEALQLNAYRILAELAGYKISTMQLQVTVRDSGLDIALSRGIDKNIYYPVPIPRLSDLEVMSFFNKKKDELLSALNNKVIPDPCTDEESWDKRKCRSYCEVRNLCSQGIIEMQAMKAK